MDVVMDPKKLRKQLGDFMTKRISRFFPEGENQDILERGAVSSFKKQVVDVVNAEVGLGNSSSIKVQVVGYEVSFSGSWRVVVKINCSLISQPCQGKGVSGGFMQACAISYINALLTVLEYMRQ